MKDDKKVKDTKKTPVKKDEDFVDEEDNKRLIIFIAVALLVIIGTIIGLLVGCQKEDKKGEDKKSPNEDIVIPVGDDTYDEDDDVYYESLTATPVNTVKKVTKVSSDNDNKDTNNPSNDDEDDDQYEVVFYYNDNEDNYVTNVADGKTVEKYLPKGYDSCNYYTDSEYTNEYDFDTKISSSKNIYMVCQATVYTINYDVESDNATTYSVDEGTIDLIDPNDNDYIFDGWYTDSNYINEVTELSKDIIDYADSNNVINLYAKFIESYKVTYYNGNEMVNVDELTKEEIDTYTAYDGSNLSDGSNNKFLGWATTSGSKSITYNSGDAIEVSSNMSLYAVFGAAKVAYVNDNEVVEEIAYTEEEMEEYELPSAEDLGMDVPTYYIPVLEDTDTSKNVIDDDATEVKDNEIKISTVKEKASEKYDPRVGDKVEEKEKELKWTTDKKIERTDTTEEQTITVDDQTEVKEIVIDNVDEGKDTTVNAEWVEQEETEGVEPTEIG